MTFGCLTSFIVDISRFICISVKSGKCKSPRKIPTVHTRTYYGQATYFGSKIPLQNRLLDWGEDSVISMFGYWSNYLRQKLNSKSVTKLERDSLATEELAQENESKTLKTVFIPTSNSTKTVSFADEFMV